MKEVFCEMEDQKEDSAEGEEQLVVLCPDIIEIFRFIVVFLMKEITTFLVIH